MNNPLPLSFVPSTRYFGRARQWGLKCNFGLWINDCGFKEFPENINPKSKIKNPKYGKSPLGDLGVGLVVNVEHREI